MGPSRKPRTSRGRQDRPARGPSGKSEDVVDARGRPGDAQPVRERAREGTVGEPRGRRADAETVLAVRKPSTEPVSLVSVFFKKIIM